MPKPDTQEIVNALKIICRWAVGGNRTGNPYGHEEVKQALIVLDRCQNGTGEWGNAVTDPNVRVLSVNHMLAVGFSMIDLPDTDKDGQSTFADRLKASDESPEGSLTVEADYDEVTEWAGGSGVQFTNIRICVTDELRDWTECKLYEAARRTLEREYCTADKQNAH